MKISQVIKKNFQYLFKNKGKILIKYFSRNNKNYFYSLSHQINFGSIKANNFYIRSLKKSKFYFEYGSGNSSMLAKRLSKNFISIECDKSFFNDFKKRKIHEVKFTNIGPTLKYSYPIFFLRKKIVKYVEKINSFILREKIPDLILIDGRFRVSCCLNLTKFKKELMNAKTIILLDDFQKRNYYKILNKYFFIGTCGRMAILKFKNNFPSKNTFSKFIEDPR